MTADRSAVPTVTASNVNPESYVLDVRERNEWQAGRAPQAHHVPMGQVVARIGEIPDSGSIVVVCRSGVRSARVTIYLNQTGRSAENLDGGMQAWEASGCPMVGDGPGAPFVA
jgi:rhodanese-related sulfurtransferase